VRLEGANDAVNDTGVEQSGFGVRVRQNGGELLLLWLLRQSARIRVWEGC
jgi:hypothetical protein